MVFINPKMLKFAREQSGLSLEEATKSYLNAKKLEKAEKGEVQLTFKQFLNIANVYKRPPAFFYLEKPLKEDLINDFRTLKSKDIKFSPILRDQIKIIKEKRNLAVKFQKYDKQYDYFYINSITFDDNPELVALKIFDMLNIDMKKRRKWKSKYDALNGWKSAIENIGILIFQISGVKIKEMRGFSISKTPYPTIVLNRSDSPLGRIFTLIHELVHIMLAKGGICTHNLKDERHYKVEEFCNAVSGAVLVPRNLLEKTIIVKRHRSMDWKKDELDSLKKIFWVSHEVILRRLLIIEQTTKDFYQEMRKYWSKLSKPLGGGPERQSKKVISTHSTNYIKIVLNALYNNQITFTDVSYYLNMKLKYLPALESYMKS